MCLEKGCMYSSTKSRPKGIKTATPCRSKFTISNTPAESRRISSKPSHDPLKSCEGRGVCWEAPEKAWQEASPVPSPPSLGIHSARSVSPAKVLAVWTKRICHDALFHHISGVAGDPEDLSRETTSIEIDCCGRLAFLLNSHHSGPTRRRQICIVLETSCE